ncbi:MAG: PQQ-binding-like beta-propeller repeat protein [Candidatus Aenigmarchaeota archaeon]|nr:PQQ-binding-like beta-propeller repeat protein [Candidatus Aenigmarchaeota archaeon]
MRYLIGYSVASSNLQLVPGKMEADLYIAGLLESIKNTKDTQIFDIGVGGSILGDPVVHENVVYFGACDKNFYAVSLKDGKEIWSFVAGDVIGNVSLEGSTLYFGSFDKNVYALSLSGGLLWKFSSGGKIIAKPAVHEGAIYVGASDGCLYALSATSGRLMWKFNTYRPIITDVLVHKDTIYLGSYDGILYALTLDGRVKWKFNAKSFVGSPVVHQDRIFFASFDRHLYCLDMAGKMLWSFRSDGILTSRPLAVHDNLVFPASRNGYLYAVTVDGKLMWKFKVGEEIFVRPSVGQCLYFGSADYTFYCVDFSGKEKWRFQTRGPIASSSYLHDDKVIFGSWDCNLYCLDTEGKLLWRFPTKLSHMAPVNVESKPETITALEVTWKPEELRQEERYRNRAQEAVGLSQYGDFNTGYVTKGAGYISMDNKDYLGKKRKK